MISVQNRRLRLSGNKLYLLAVVLLITAACAPRVRVLKPGGTGVEEKPEKETPVKTERKEEAKPEVESRNIALLLPFELHKANPAAPGTADVKRAELALDFYQGFKTGLDAVTHKGGRFNLSVLDSRDDTEQARQLGMVAEVQEADLIVGPVYPKEIIAFGSAASLENKLQVSPLAATQPSQFNNPNLVSITPPVDYHVQALAAHLVKQHRTGDVLILYDNGDEDSRKFLVPLDEAIVRQSNNRVKPVVVNDETSLETSLRLSARNVVVAGFTSRYAVLPMLDKLNALQTEGGYHIQLYGHPNWAKTPLANGFLSQLHTRITSSYYINERAAGVREFTNQYHNTYRVAPTEFAFKGYDAGVYFGSLLNRYGKEYKQHITKERHQGLHNTFVLEHNPAWGYVNTHIMILQFEGDQFRPLQ